MGNIRRRFLGNPRRAPSALGLLRNLAIPISHFFDWVELLCVLIYDRVLAVRHFPDAISLDWNARIELAPSGSLFAPMPLWQGRTAASLHGYNHGHIWCNHSNRHFAQVYLLIWRLYPVVDAESLDDICPSLPACSQDVNQVSVFCENVSHRFHIVVVPSLLKCHDSGSNGWFIRSLRRRCVPDHCEEQPQKPKPDETTSKAHWIISFAESSGFRPFGHNSFRDYNSFAAITD